MSLKVSYSEAKKDLASLIDKAVDEDKIITIKRSGRKDVALISAHTLFSLLEADYLLPRDEHSDDLRSPRS